MSTLHVLIVDDHPPFRMGLSVLLEQYDDIHIVDTAGTGEEALQSIRKLNPHIVLLDCQLPDTDGPALAEKIIDIDSSIKIVALSAFDNLNYVRQLLEIGAVGYLLKNESPETIVTALRAVVNGGNYFSDSITTEVLQYALGTTKERIYPTAREAEVLDCLLKGMTNAQIARNLDVSERTAAYHIVNLQDKLGAENRTQIVVEAIRRKWISAS